MFCIAVHKLWSSKDTRQVEAVVGPYKLYVRSFRALSGKGWLSDEVKVRLCYMQVYRLTAVSD